MQWHTVVPRGLATPGSGTDEPHALASVPCSGLQARVGGREGGREEGGRREGRGREGEREGGREERREGGKEEGREEAESTAHSTKCTNHLVSLYCTNNQ